jgi:glycosyltransferase involved in cell wall biosynthesis
MIDAPPSILLLLPERQAASGNAGRYNDGLLAALPGTIRHVALPGWFPRATDAARALAANALAAREAGTIAVIDGIALGALAADAKLHRTIALMHHTLPLAKDMAAAEREAYEARMRALLPQLSGVIASSETTRQTLIESFGLTPGRITVVEPGLPDLPRATGSGSDTCQIISAGALVPRKGHDVLLAALARLCDLDWHLTITGGASRDPLHAASLESFARDNGIFSRVTFAGEPDAADEERLWQQADLFALASRSELSAAIVARAMRRGLPVAITAFAASQSLVPPEAGVIAAVGDAAGLSKAMRRLIFSRELRQAFGANALEAALALPDWPRQAQAFIAASLTLAG